MCIQRTHYKFRWTVTLAEGVTLLTWCGRRSVRTSTEHWLLPEEVTRYLVATAVRRAVVIIRVTPRSQGPRMLCSVRRERSSPKQPTTNCMLCAWRSITHDALPATGSAGFLSTPLVLWIIRSVLWSKRLSSVWLLWKYTRHYDLNAFLMRVRIFGSFRSKEATFIRAVTRCECMKQIPNRQYKSVVVWTKLN